MSAWPEAVTWHRAIAVDAVLAAWRGPWSVNFAIARDGASTSFSFADGELAGDGGVQFTLTAPDLVWGKFLAAVPPRHHHSIFAMLARVADFSVRGEEMAFLQHAHVARRVLEIGKWLALGHPAPVPPSLQPRLGSTGLAPKVTGGYLPVYIGGTSYNIYHECAGTGRDLLCLHTAGADGRQFHRLMADPRIAASHRLVAFDLPWHGKSPPPADAIPGSWRLNTDLYVDLIMGFIEAARLDRPIVLGASMSGEICLELAYRYPDAFAGIIACEASERIERRQTPFSNHPQINAAYFVPEWIRGLIAPLSPAECAAEIAWLCPGRAGRVLRRHRVLCR